MTMKGGASPLLFKVSKLQVFLRSELVGVAAAKLTRDGNLKERN
jgi:hypothetical protein